MPPDLTEDALRRAYANFSLPTSAEGFDEIVFEWRGEEEAGRVLREWVYARKLATRVEDLRPGNKFREAWAQWVETLEGRPWGRLGQKSEGCRERRAPRVPMACWVAFSPA